MRIDKETYKIGEVNRYKTQNPKTQIIMGTSLRKDSNHILRLQHKEYGKTKKWNTYTISRTGIVYEHYDPKFHTDFLGIKEVDKNSISIVLENMGALFKTTDGKYVNWLNEVCDENQIIEREWLGYHFWEKISEEQMKSTILLNKFLCGKFNIPKSVIDFHHHHKDSIKFRGVVFRSNYIQDSSDINPLFDIENFNKLLHNK